MPAAFAVNGRKVILMANIASTLNHPPPQRMKTALLPSLRPHRCAISPQVKMLNGETGFGRRRLRLNSAEFWKGQVLFHYSDDAHKFTFCADWKDRVFAGLQSA